MAVPRRLRKYVGLKADVGGGERAAALYESSSCSLAFYPRTSPDGAMFDRLVYLCRETAPYLYSEHTPLTVDYQRGSRALLEGLVKDVLRGKRRRRDKVLALLAFVRDIPGQKKRRLQGVLTRAARTHSNDPFAGGTEEDVIHKCSSMCNEQARVLIVMLQIARIPSRYVGHICGYDKRWKHMSGHGVAEAYVNGKWAYLDIRGQYFLDGKGRMLSAWDILQDPSVIDRQPREVLRNLLPGSSLDSSRKYFSPQTMTFIANYFASEFARFDFTWQWPTKEFNDRISRTRRDSHARAMQMLGRTEGRKKPSRRGGGRRAS